MNFRENLQNVDFLEFFFFGGGWNFENFEFFENFENLYFQVGLVAAFHFTFRGVQANLPYLPVSLEKTKVAVYR